MMLDFHLTLEENKDIILINGFVILYDMFLWLFLSNICVNQNTSIDAM